MDKHVFARLFARATVFSRLMVGAALVAALYVIAPSAQAPLVGNFDAFKLSGVDATVLLRATVTLTNAQIKAAQTTYVTVVAAPGAGKYLLLHRAVAVIDATAGAYTNIDVTDGQNGITIAYGDWDQEASTFVTMSGTAEKFVLPFSPFTVAPTAGVLANAPPYPTYSDRYSPQSDIVNKPLKLVVWNNMAGDYTGGNVANTGVVRVYYTIENAL